jgi:hypothetical protein
VEGMAILHQTLDTHMMQGKPRSIQDLSSRWVDRHERCDKYGWLLWLKIKMSKDAMKGTAEGAPNKRPNPNF